MTWTKTPDDYPDHLIDLSDAAYRLHHAATTYSNRVGTDGHIAKARLTLVPVPSKTRRARVIEELVAAGLWILDGDGRTMADFLEHQMSAEEARLTKRYHAERESHRLAKGTPNEDFWKQRRDATLHELQAERERRKGRSGSAVGMPDGMTPLRLATPRSATERERGREARASDDSVVPDAAPECWLCDRSLLEEPWRTYQSRSVGDLANFHDRCWEAATKESAKETGPERFDYVERRKAS